ncbi:MAG: adenylate/guanylate cyclase domain-containing protein, partial [Bdellovibrionales bacterium]|nr:adenylate/guanylate cyclase domain-containing protein [Bdellovibrionales bacterium]
NFNFHLNFYSDKNLFTTFKFDSIYEDSLNLLQGNIDDPEELEKKLKNSFEDKIVLIGGSAAGLEDLKVIPTDSDYPGALIHAVTISNILNNDYLKHPPDTINYLIPLLLILIIYLNFIFISNTAVKNTLPFFLIGLYAVFAFYFFKLDNLQLPIATPLFFGFLSYGDSLAYLTFTESKQKKKILGTLSKYLSPQVTTQLFEQGIDPTAEIGRKEELSILFSDIRGFTTLSESISPEQVVEILNFYLGKMTDLVFSNKGTLDKFIGDAVMAFWGAPITDKTHALNAVKTALSMKDQMSSINNFFSQKYNTELHIGIGVNTGDVIVGNIGSDKRLDYTVIGDNVNLASRLEGLTKNYGVNIIIGKRTFELIKNDILCRPIDWVQVKGKNDSTKIYEPLVSIEKAIPDQYDLVQLYSEALDEYRNGNFNKALIDFRLLAEKNSDKVSNIMAQRCEYLLSNPPENWTGIFKFTSK